MVRWAILHVPLRNLIAGMHNLGHTLNAKETNSFAYLCSIILCLPMVEGARRAASFQLPSPSLPSRQETRVAAALLRPPYSFAGGGYRSRQFWGLYI
jgi:hypothetical protein